MIDEGLITMIKSQEDIYWNQLWTKDDFCILWYVSEFIW